ncbi:hypothetical protein O6H91_Y142300 [Diphasiastrum complanatum]|nr:hypothetical protein O6H91_Y142300 [Diphasiastrum complanatum]
MPGVSALNLMNPYSRNQMDDDEEETPSLAPFIGFTSGGHAKSIELYGAYVVRQIGLSKSSEVGKRLAEVAERYLHGGEQSPSNQTLESLICFINGACPRIGDEELGFLNRELVKELDACMLSYFSFHWHYTAELLDQVRGGERTLRHVVMTATRKQRVQRVMKTLKMKRVFSTLLDELKAMRGHKISSVADEEMEATNPASPISRKPDAKAQNPDAQVRYPVLLLIGGEWEQAKALLWRKSFSPLFGQDLRTVLW